MKNMSESAISAKSAKQIFTNFAKFVKPICGTTRRSEGSVTEAEYPTNYQRISNLSLTIRPFRVAILAVLLLFVGGWNTQAWGVDLVNDGSEYEIENRWSSSNDKEFAISKPASIIYFSTRKYWSAIGTIELKIYDASGSHKVTIDVDGKSSVDLTQYSGYRDFRKFVFHGTGTERKYVSGVRIVMAQYLDAPSKTSFDFGTGKVDDTNSIGSFTIAWCNVPAMTYKVAGTGSEKIGVSIAKNSSESNYGTATITVTYNRNAASTLDATLIISNTYGNYSKEIALKGTTSRHDQTLSWNGDVVENMMNGSEQSCAATATSGLAVSYSSSNSSVLSVDPSTGLLTAKAKGGPVTITASQAGNYKYNEATSIPRTFYVKDKDTPDFKPSGFSESGTNDIFVGDVLTLDVKNVDGGLNGDFTAVYDATYFNVTRAGNTISIEALNAGNGKNVTFTQAVTSTNFGDSKTYTFNISKITNTLDVKVTTHEMFVDDEWSGIINAGVAIKNRNNTDVPVSVTSDDEELLRYVSASDKVVAPNDAKELFGASKKVTLTFSQPETYKYTAASKTIEVTVKKYPNSISCSWGSWTKTLNFEKGANITFSSNNNLTSITPIVVTQTSGAENATYYPAPDNVIYGSYNNNASATWSVSQAENYKYVAATTQTLTVNVAKDADPGCDITLFTALTGSSKKVSETDQSNGFDLGGVGVKLSLHIKTNGYAGNDANLYTRTATSGWTKLQEVSAPLGGECDIHNIALPEGTTHIKFTKGGDIGTDDPYIKDIVVTRTHYFDIENAGGTAITTLDMPQNTPTGNVKTATFYIDYSTCADKIKLVSSHDRIKFTANNSTTYEFSTTPNHYGRQAIEVSYTSPSEAEELHETITIFTPYDNKVLNINAETIGKLATYIHYIGDASYPVDAENIAASALFEVRDANNALVPNATIILASNSEKAPIVENKVNPECGGNVTITASYSGDDAHEAAQDLNQIITIARLEDEVKIMLPSIMVVGDEYDLSNFVTAKSATNITFLSSNTSIVDFENGKLVVKSKGSGSATMRVTSAGNCIYNPGEEEIELTIRTLTDPCNSLLLDSVHKANLGAYSGYTLRNPKKYVIADGPMDILTYKVWKYTAATQDIHIWLTSKDYTDANAGFNAEEDIIEEIVYLSTELPTSKDAAINGSIDMKVGNRPNTKYIFAFAADANYILPGTLYKYISNVKITQQCYLTGSTSSLSMPTVTACETAKAEFTVDYSDVGPIRLTSNAGDRLTYEVWKNGVKIDDFDNNCGDYGTYTIKLFYTPLTAGDYSGKVTISASGKEVDVDFSGTVNAAEREIVWNVSNQNKAFVNKLVENVLTAYAKTDCVDPAGEVTYTIVPEGAATINGSSVTFNTTGTVTITAATVASGLYGAATPVSKTWNIAEGYVFSGSGTWDVEGGWEGDLIPSTNQDVIVTGHLTIDGDRVVNSLTIEGTGSVTMVENGKLTINGTSKDAEKYGNLYVLNGGEVEVNGDLKVGDLTVEASIGTSDGTAESGQVENAGNIVYANAYIEINMDPKGTMDDTKWYGFTVPFDVDAHAGISRKEGDTYRQCVYGTHYMIAEYDANKRLNTGKGWKYITGNTLYAGTFYYFTVNGNYNTYRFKAKEAAYTQAAPATLAMNGSTSNPNANWNGVGNSTLRHAKVSFGGGNYVQVYQNGLDAYRTVSASEATFVVGCPFFIQATEASTVVLDAPTSATESYYAPRRSSASQNGVARVNLTSIEGGYSDRIYVSGTDKEENAYIAGRDLAKAGESKVVPQLWVDAYNQKLSVHEAAWQGENAICPLGIYAPKEGEYTLTATQPEDGTQVYLTIDGMPVWNISETAYILSLGKGMMNNYGLMLLQASRMPTGVENVESADDEKAQKIILNNQLYILRDNRMYDVTGKKVK